MKDCKLILLMVILLSYFMMAQENNSDILKSKIEILYKNNNINAVNDIINKGNSLNSEYVFEILNRNLEYSKKHNNYIDIANTHLLLGNFWHQQANKIKAFENYLQAETFSRKINEKNILASSLMNKATLTENGPEKIETLQETLQIFLEKKDTVNQIKIYLNLGVVYGQLYEDNNDSLYSVVEIQGFKKKSFQYYSYADKLNKNVGNKEIEGTINVYYGEWYYHEKQFEKANNSFKKAKQFLDQTKNTKAQTYCLYMLAKISYEMKNYAEAKTLLKQAENLAEKYNFNDYLVRIYDQYVRVYMEEDDLSNALAYNNLYAEKAIEMAEQSNNDQMKILSLEKNIAENKLQLNEYEARSKINRILIFSSLLIALFITGISYLIIKNNKRKINNIEQSKVITDLERSAVEIKLKNQILEDELLKEKVKYSQNHLMLFANQVNKIDTFLSTLKNELRDSFPEKQDKINSLKISFSEVLNNQNELKQLNSLSSQLNQEFFFYLRQNYPIISREDEQLLSFIILDMSSKEISHNLSISPESVYTKRYRLRKKLNIPNEDSFIHFYEKITQQLKTNSE